MDTPFMDIVQSETLRGFTELTLFYMSDLDVFIKTMLPQSIRVCARD